MDKNFSEVLTRPLKVGEKFLMKTAGYQDVSSEMKKLAGQWLTVSNIHNTKWHSQVCYNARECSNRWIWIPSHHINIKETNQRIQMADLRKVTISKTTPRLPSI